MCLNHDLTTTELRALLSDAIATARRTRDGLDDALHALATHSSAPDVCARCADDRSPRLSGVGDPDKETAS